MLTKGDIKDWLGKLIYLSHTRPNINFVISVVSQFMNKRLEEYMEVVFRILRDVKMTLGQGLFVKKMEKKEIKIGLDL